MKQNHSHDQTRSASRHLEPVYFEFIHSTAGAVCLAGTFNEWNPNSKPMHSTGDGHWLNETALPPGTYEYCLVVDGHWMPDPRAADSVANPFGGRNSLLVVPGSPGAAEAKAAKNLSR